LSSGFRRAGATVLKGSVAGYGINLLLTPLISRLFAPDTFGLFATITAVVSVFVGVSTFRLEVLSQRVRHDAEARDLLWLAFATSVAWGLAITLVAVFCAWTIGISRWWIIAGPLVTLASLELIGSAALARQRSYRDLAVSNFVQGAGAGIIQVALGWAGAGLASLFLGFGAARLVWVRAVDLRRRPTSPLNETWSRSRRYAAVSGGSALINSCAGQLPVLLAFALFGSAQAGFLAMALRLLIAPLGIVGQAAAAATLGEVGALLRAHDSAASTVVKGAMRDLLLIGIVPCGLAAVLGVWAVPFLLGAQWGPSGVLVALLSVGAMAQFTVAPFSQLLNIADHNRWLLAWDIMRFILIGSSFWLTNLLGGSLLFAGAAYSAALVVLYVVLARLSLAAVQGDEPVVTKSVRV
jgi:O-antigen/teichoic acid export membrane protein